MEWMIDRLIDWLFDKPLTYWWQTAWQIYTGDWQTNLLIDHVIGYWLIDFFYYFFTFPLGVSLNMWRFDGETKKLYISRSFVFTNLQVSYM